MTESNALTRCRVVLVRPHYSGNLGSVARVMRNFGLNDLVLVNPIAKPESMDAVMMSTQGLSILKSARTVTSLPEALADRGFVLATSGEVGGITRKGYWGTPEEKIPALLDALPQTPTALVFGPEPSGLTLEEIATCHGMIFIPASEEYQSLNLAQSVAVVLYELRKEWLKRHEPQKAFGLEPPLDFEHQEILFQHLKEALTSIRFLWDFRSDGIFHVIRQVLARAMPTQKEAAVFHGLAKQLDFIARNYGIVHPRDGRPPSMKRPAKPSPPTESAQPEVPFEQFPTAELHEQFPAAPAGDRAVSVPEKPLDPA